MTILGVESVVFGVDDLDACVRFWEDFGLRPLSFDGRRAVFEVASGARIIVLRHDDERLPPRSFEGNGIRRTTWGVDTAENLEALALSLQEDVAIERAEDGSILFQAPDGQHLGLRVWTKRPIVSISDPVNSPGVIKRLNQHRQWRRRAIPKTINHVVFFSPDYVGSYDFYRDKLGFRYSDHSKGIGIFARADGAYEHHSIFWVNSALPFAPGGHGFMHIAFGLDDIDEVMIGANIMAKRGWTNTSANASGGISRHRISSAIYYYIDNPNGGEAEYHADTDYVDDNWVPRAWNFKFGAIMWAAQLPPMFAEGETEWDMQFDPDERSLAPFRKTREAVPPAFPTELTSQDEHAI